MLIQKTDDNNNNKNEQNNNCKTGKKQNKETYKIYIYKIKKGYLNLYVSQLVFQVHT